jgi:hypothetical protein
VSARLFQRPVAAEMDDNQQSRCDPRRLRDPRLR